MSEDSEHASLREKVLEHIFIGDLLRCLWRRGMRQVEILRAEVDAAGYDLVLEYGEQIRHVQLKASHAAAKRQHVNININLARKMGGCVIWLWYEPETMALTKFLWFGGTPGEALPPLGDKIGKHSKGNRDGFKAERPNIRLLSKSRFAALPDMEAVADRLFARAGDAA